MPRTRITEPPPRLAVVDLGSNSVRLVVFEGLSRNPLTIFNEKAVLGLGRGLQNTGLLNEAAIGPALTVMGRYAAVARAMGAETVEVVATAAARDAENGPDFIAALRDRHPDMPVRVLTGEEEANLSADGVLLGFPDADGILGDLGGGSLEVVELDRGRAGAAASLPIGAIRLADRAGGDPARARAIVEADLARVPWLKRGEGRDLYLVGGAWRALARMHIAQTDYPLSIVHHYVLRREEARDLAGVVAKSERRMLERMPGAPAKRLGDMPFAAVVLRRLLRATGARRVVFSANGLREGWYARLLPEAVRRADPMLEAGRDLALRWGRDPDLPTALQAWTAPLFEAEPPDQAALREACCWIADIGSHDHPDYRAEQAFFRVLRQPGVGLDHHQRAFLALVVALRYEAEPLAPCLATARSLLDATAVKRAEALGAALRLAFTLSGGTPILLAGTALHRRGEELVLRLVEGSGVFAGESVQRRLDVLAAALGLVASVEVAAV
ncbi:Ppx/GppA family phosphatase [Falsiroseomonas selenitidurans]|uniref:Ppx/GppA family phosphatase n=1 Tax=Falsiroseomonas selenitidurans TaxID=2716335 RepID=A0ABX1E3Z9_9PROT|nr:Ppx/GppA family phosphatase [Falsiroseomonas selenitidurans]NKC31811.1 Ppx/GppA family phosphatase [Falsiroseomonas selenitidurans]